MEQQQHLWMLALLGSLKELLPCMRIQALPLKLGALGLQGQPWQFEGLV
jgi:hypothetical protein